MIYYPGPRQLVFKKPCCGEAFNQQVKRSGVGYMMNSQPTGVVQGWASPANRARTEVVGDPSGLI